MTYGEGFVLGLFVQYGVFLAAMLVAFPWAQTPGVNRAIAVLVSATAVSPFLIFFAWALENVTVSWK